MPSAHATTIYQRSSGWTSFRWFLLTLIPSVALQVLANVYMDPQQLGLIPDMNMNLWNRRDPYGQFQQLYRSRANGLEYYKLFNLIDNLLMVPCYTLMFLHLLGYQLKKKTGGKAAGAAPLAWTFGSSFILFCGALDVVENLMTGYQVWTWPKYQAVPMKIVEWVPPIKFHLIAVILVLLVLAGRGSGSKKTADKTK